MSNLPDPIERTWESNEGYEYERRDDELIYELIEKFNELLHYLENNLSRGGKE